ncbi:4Fe-4S dicluster domain-containing protein [Peptacetobacter hominis]|uniref:4Fe-4S dicluster domain-containing protein n=1 Tax=Peptacetobacter hominis TaxID=2743610 RepID=A0A544QVJ1_9FIRM|nr:4Fe-4S dicluster domain-containing protein [Peptacetobacter hominis]TQQ84714.1 4Fe-4S dicluster domain-containing protein [Peptacetobacter hominis]
MKKIVYNIGLCDGCFKCHTACSNVHKNTDGQSCRKMKRIHNPIDNYARIITDACRHCDEPICANNCPNEAIYRNEETGFIIVDKEKCTGCQICSFVCPYDIPKFVKGKMIKCDGCNDIVLKGGIPACVEICDRKALRIVDVK